MAVNGVALGIASAGAVFAYAGIRGVSVTAVIQDVVTGKSPTTAAVSNAFNISSLIAPGGTSAAIGTAGSAAAGSVAVTPSGSGAGLSPAQYQAFAFSLFPSFGWGQDQEAPLIALWDQESGWDPTAYFPSTHTTNPDNNHAFGIPQALPASKMASAGADWRTNGYTQIKWGLGYIKATYGNPANAEAHEKANNWY